jgi:hypothetical protein
MPSKGDISNKSKALAGWLKDHGVTRTTGQCPWGCGHGVPNGGPALLAHLARCQGSPKRDRRR